MKIPLNKELTQHCTNEHIRTHIIIDEDYEDRRKRFTYRIQYLEDEKQNLEDTRRELPQEQILLARKMAAAQQRILCLNEEIERVVSHEDKKMLSSHLLHGAIQVGLS